MLRLRWYTIGCLVFAAILVAFYGAGAQEATTERADLKKQTALPKAEGHWGEDALGFRWVEDDSADARWNEMDTGSFMASSLTIPTGLVTKSVSVRVGKGGPLASVCFDTRNLVLRCGWTGGFLRYTPARFGVIAPPEIQGRVEFAVPEGPGWNGQHLAYRGHYRSGARVVFSYAVDGVDILESPWAEVSEQRTVFHRTLRVEAATQSLITPVAPAGTSVQLLCSDAQMAQHCELQAASDEPVRLRIVPRNQPIQVTVLIGDAIASSASDSVETGNQDLVEWTRGGPAQWGPPLETRGECGEDSDALVVDTIAVPFQNRFRALMFLSGHDFFSTPGSAAVSTMHGDVWLVTGLDRSLEKVQWKRIATGLYQPLGLRIIKDEIYVLGRDRITRLHDLNQDHEIDFYESFCNEMPTSAGGHDFTTCLETDSQGRFYYVSHAGVHRVSADGQHWETVASGLRNANGMGINARDCVTVAPQEGEWTPASAVYEVTEGGYYGYGGPQITTDRPLGYDRPLFWSPRLFDNSTGGQVWVERSDWGPLNDHMLTLSFGQCRILFNLLEPRRYELPSHWPIVGSRRVEVPESTPAVTRGATYTQGGSISLPLHFSSGIMRGRMNSHDGYLYLTGLRGWVSAAAADGCFQRVRYTGRPFYHPMAIRTLANGIALTFAEPLDRETAEDPDSYHIEQWNYAYGAHYGSHDFRVSQPKVEGRDQLAVRTATLLDERTVFLQTDSVQPVMQMAIAFTLNARNGQRMRDVYYHTINVVPDVRIDESRLTQPRPRGERPSDTSVSQGMMWRFESLADTHGDAAPAIDWRADRMVALSVPAGRSPASGLPSGRFRADADGFVQLPLRDGITFSLAGRGRVELRLNDQLVLAGESEDLSTIARRTIPLHKGYNRLQVAYESPVAGDAWIRLFWSGSEFATEPLPPAVLFHPKEHLELQRATIARRGAERFQELRCANCHALSSEPAAQQNGTGPDLRGIGRRVRREWIAQWLFQPDTLREANHREMPQLLDHNALDSRQTAWNLATFLSQLPSDHVADEPSGDRVSSQVSDSALAQGLEWFQKLNCQACHHEMSAEAKDDFRRLSLAAVRRKFSPEQLVRFLQEPDEHYRLIRMPKFSLSDGEARALAAYLTREDRSDEAKAEAERLDSMLDEWATMSGDADAGRNAFHELGCAACHGDPLKDSHRISNANESPSQRSIQAMDKWTSIAAGCVSAERTSGHRGPHYRLSPEDRAALAGFFQEKRWQRVTQECLSERASQAMNRWNCAACHERDEQTSDRLAILAEEGNGQLPELLPSLTWTGEKLQTDWVRGLLRGEHARPARPWLHARMPAFPALADSLTEGLAQQHGLPAPLETDSPRETSDREQVELGHRLIQKSALDCVQCHAVGSLQPQGDERTQIALGINLALTRQRLREEFFHRFVLDPPRYDVRTKMPKLATDGRTTKVADILDGDARRQFQSIWQYIQQLEYDTSDVSKGSTP